MNKRKIVLIGPVFPYKGGISHYNSLLYKHLKNKYEIELISFKLQYPKILFKKEQKDYKDKLFEIQDAKFLLNTINPFNIVKVAYYIKGLNPDLVIFHWWHPFFTPCYKIMLQILNKTKTCFICHNVFPHERFLLDTFIVRTALNNVCHYIVHSQRDVEDLLSLKSSADYKLLPLLTFDTFKTKKIDIVESRKILGIDNNRKILLFFGFIREYKGLKYLLEAMSLLQNDRNEIDLLIVGDFNGKRDEYENIISNLNIQNSVTIVDDYISDENVQIYFQACDVVVLPYISATQSGVVQIAYDFNKPVIASNVGGLPEVVIEGKTGYLVPPCDPKLLASSINSFFYNVNGINTDNIEIEKRKYSWNRMTEVIDSFLK